MNILFLTKEYNHKKLPHSGGIGTFIKTLAAELTQRGHKVYVFGSAKKNITFDDNGVLVHFEKSFYRKKRFYELAKSLTKKINILHYQHQNVLDQERKYIAKRLKKFIVANKLQIDIIEAHDYDGLFKFLAPMPFVVRCHGSAAFLNKHFDHPIDQFKIRGEHSAFEKAEHIVAVSSFAKTANEKLFGKIGIRKIYNSIDPAQFIPDDSAVIKDSIFYFGTLSEKKGVKCLCNIFNEIYKKRPQTSLHIIGRNDSYWNYLKNEVLSPEARDSVTYYGAKPFPEIIDYLKKAELFIFPTKGETLGLVFIEAMALEKPIIISDIQVSEEIIEHGEDGYIAKNNEDFIILALQLLEDKELGKSIGKNARKKVLEKFTLDRMTDETLAYYQEVIDSYNTLK